MRVVVGEDEMNTEAEGRGGVVVEEERRDPQE